MLNILINFVAPILGLIGFIYNYNVLMIIAIVLNIIPFIVKTISGQPYQIKFLIALLIMAFISSKLFDLSILQSLTIFLVFLNAILLFFTFIFFIIQKVSIGGNRGMKKGL